MQKTVILDDRRGHQKVIQQVTLTPSRHASKQVFLTQAEYDAIIRPDDATLYFILEG
jgi:hypothetical protein